MNHSDSILYREAGHNNRSRGVAFREEKTGSLIRFDESIPFYLLFLLKGSVKIKTGHDEIHVNENEFFTVSHTMAVKCITTCPSRFVVIDLNHSIHTDIFPGMDTNRVHTYPIRDELRLLLQYLMATMPLNETIRHHSISGIIQIIMRKYYPALKLKEKHIDSTIEASSVL